MNKQPRARVCPNCGVLVDPRDTHCFQCGASMAPAAMPGLRLWIKRHVSMQGNVTWGIFFVNVLIFLFSWRLSQGEMGWLSGPNFEVLNKLGAKNTFLIVKYGQYWRLVTAMFLHASILHIFFNMWVFLDLGQVVEEIYGWQRFLFFYLFSGVAGFLASVIFFPRVPSLGASGAILGLAGALLAYSVRNWNTYGRQLGRRIIRWFIYILVIGLLLSGVVDNAAHIGGFASGFCVALPFRPGRSERFWEKIFGGLLGWGSLLVILSSFAALASSF